MGNDIKWLVDNWAKIPENFKEAINDGKNFPSQGALTNAQLNSAMQALTKLALQNGIQAQSTMASPLLSKSGR